MLVARQLAAWIAVVSIFASTACSSNPHRESGDGGAWADMHLVDLAITQDSGVDAAAAADLLGTMDLRSPDLLSPPSTVPTDPIAFTKNDPFTVDSGTTNWVFVPTAYDATHQTPIVLFVWLHGCGGYSEGDIWSVSPGGSTQTWISLAVGGREGDCWNMEVDPDRVLAAIAELKTHFNIKPNGIIMGGYSSGGDLSYRTAFYNALDFAGIVVANTSPFRDTGSSESASIAAAAWRFHIVHLAHKQDTTYPIAGVEDETDALLTAGFPLELIEVDGEHWNDAGDLVNGKSVPGTSADIATYLFPRLDDGWTTP